MSYEMNQRQHQMSLLTNSTVFPPEAALGGHHLHIPKPFILKDGKHNLYKDCVEDAIHYFKVNKIHWWRKIWAPPGNLLSSQIACVNHLFPIRHNKKAVIRLLQTVDADFVDVLKIDTDKPGTKGYISLEAVCTDDYLNEGLCVRGGRCTAVDALIIGKRSSGEIILAVIEWKYTESYNSGAISDKSLGSPGEERKSRYSELVAQSKYLKGQWDTEKVYHHEPFYQLMRQTLWAEQMVLHGYAGASGFINIHVIPSGNEALLKCRRTWYHTGGNMGSLEDIWKNQLYEPDLYKIMSPEELLATQPENDLKKYLRARYWGHSKAV